MNRPTPTDFAIGSRAAVTASTGAAALSTLAWLGSHTVSWVMPALALLSCRACIRAKRRVVAWREWRSAWDEMADAGAHDEQPPARPASDRTATKDAAKESPAPSRRKPQRVPRWLVISGWIVLLAWIAGHEGDTPTLAHGLIGLCFAALTLWGAAVSTLSVGRFLLVPASKARGKATAPHAAPGGRDNATDADGNPIVAQCLPVPNVTPSGHVRDLLPDYCRTLLASGKATSDVQPERPSNHAG